MAMGIDMQQPSPDSLIVEKINFLQTDLFLIKGSDDQPEDGGTTYEPTRNFVKMEPEHEESIHPAQTSFRNHGSP
jgi:hypothetical protein